jgi:hypothetical protein
MSLIRNAIRTPDGTVLESKSVHDYRTYMDTVTNREYMIDGGLDYCRRSAWGDEENLSIPFDSSTHEQRREHLTWGTRGPNGDQPLRRVSIKDMTTDHIQACLDTQSHMNSKFREVMEEELRIRSQA